LTQCRYRRQARECDHLNRWECLNMDVCELCLMGQQADSTELQTSAMSNLAASIEEYIWEH